MELVVLHDLQSSFASNWARVANTTGIDQVKVGDCFRERGFGPGAEEMRVDGVDISVVGGASRLFFNRAANNTKPEVHRLGAVFDQTNVRVSEVDPRYQPLRETVSVGWAQVEPELPALAGAPRKRGRPAGSKNKPKEEVAFPPGFE